MMKLNKLLSIISGLVLFILPSLADAQNDTTYFDKDWEETTKDMAVYFRPKPLKTGRHYEVMDFYVSTGKMQMLAYYLDSEFSIPDSISKHYFANGILQHETLNAEGKIKGTHTTYYDNGVKARECTHTEREYGRKHYRRSGELWFVERFNARQKYDGDRIYYYANGKIERKETWKNGRFKNGKCYTQSGADTTYFMHLNYPVFKGGYQAYKKYERKHLRYKSDWRAEQLDGFIRMEITVNEKGELICVETIDGAHPVLEEEARRFLYSVPAWDPGLDENYQPVQGTSHMTFQFTAIGLGALLLNPSDFILYYMYRGFD